MKHTKGEPELWPWCRELLIENRWRRAERNDAWAIEMERREAILEASRTFLRDAHARLAVLTESDSRPI